MTIQRQYTLPNCNLILEGLSTHAGGDFAETMDILVSAECHLGNSAQVLKGDRAFFESLIAAVSQYSQELLSGLPHHYLNQLKGSAPTVQLTQAGGPYHHLTMRSPEVANGSEMAGSSNATEMKLTTVQLFDLVEAIDQFLADSQTLPEMNLSVESLPRRYAKAATPVVQRALPAAIGASTLTVAAAALFMVPVPKFTPPERPAAETSQDVQGEEPAPGSTPVETAEPAASEQPADVVAAAAALDDRVETSPSITDAEQVADLQQQLETKIREQLSDRLEFTEDLVYRVAVSEQGDLIGYKYVNDAALLNVDETPLPGLTFIPLNQELVRQEPVAQFRVTFTPLGELAVEPWSDSDRAAQPPDSPEADTPEADAPEITAELPATIENEIVTPVLIEDLNQRLYRALRDRQLPELSSDLTYRVRLDEAGDVVGYEALDAASQAVLDETPLPGLATADGDTSAPQADFRIAFTQNGVLEVSPWKGWPR